MRRKTKHTRRAPAKTQRSARLAKNKRVAPRTAEQYFAKPQWFRDMWDRVTEVIAELRTHNTSLEKASRKFDIDPRTVIRRGGTALKKSTNGRYVAKPSDQLLRLLVVPTHQGTGEILVRGSRRASQLGAYWNAAQKYLEIGDASGLKKFRGRSIRAANGERIFLITDLAELDRLGSAGVLSFESLYSRST
jgi:hypothetical protein